MGADLLLLVVPKANITKERRVALDAVVAKLSIRHSDVKLYIDQNDPDVTEEFILDEVKEKVTAALDGYEDFERLRDVTFVRLAPDMEHYASGGMSWGESPSEAFEIMSTLVTFSDIYSLLEEWAREDYLNNPKNSERFKKWCKAHCQIQDAV